MSQTAVQQATIYMGTVDASATPLAFWRAPCQCLIESIHLLTSSAIAADAANIHTSTVTNRGVAAAGSDVVATQTTDSDVAGSAAIVAKTPWALVMSSTLANREVAAGEVLEIAPTEGGTATSGDLANASYVINYRVGTGVGYA